VLWGAGASRRPPRRRGRRHQSPPARKYHVQKRQGSPCSIDISCRERRARYARNAPWRWAWISCLSRRASRCLPARRAASHACQAARQGRNHGRRHRQDGQLVELGRGQLPGLDPLEEDPGCYGESSMLRHPLGLTCPRRRQHWRARRPPPLPAATRPPFLSHLSVADIYSRRLKTAAGCVKLAADPRSCAWALPQRAHRGQEGAPGRPALEQPGVCGSLHLGQAPVDPREG
jgi:hypothetical protein